MFSDFYLPFVHRENVTDWNTCAALSRIGKFGNQEENVVITQAHFRGFCKIKGDKSKINNSFSIEHQKRKSVNAYQGTQIWKIL